MCERKYSIDTLRGIATIFIVFHHYQQLTGTYWEGKLNYYNGNFPFDCLVEFFFLLSGFFIYPYIEKFNDNICFKTWYLKRVIRLLPLVCISGVVFEVLLIIYTKVFGVGWLSLGVDIWGLITNSLGIHDGWCFTNPCINNPTWYISVLLLCYLVFFTITYLSQKHDVPYIYSYIFMIMLGCGIITYKIDLPFFNTSTARGYYAFFFGLLLAIFIHEHKLKRVHYYLATFAVVVITYILVFHFQWLKNGLNFLLTFIYYPAILFVFLSKPIEKITNYRIIGELGKITYNIYIWHIPNYLLALIMIELLNFSIDITAQQTMYAFGAICFIIGVISYYFLEKPIQKFITRMYISNK